MGGNFINKGISFFANKKKILIISLSIVILFIVGFLYNTYATSTGVALGNEDNTYDILLTDSSNTVSVPAKSSKTVYYQFSNTNKGTVKYHIGYISDNVTAKVWWDSEDPISDTIEYGEYKFIKLKLINDTTSDDTITIKPVLGFANGGDVIPDSNITLVTGNIKETNIMSIAPTTALSTLGVDKTNVKEISFVNDNIPSSDSLGSTNMNDDGSVKLWYTNSDTSGLYNVYIGSDNGITSFPDNSSDMFIDYNNLEILEIANINTSNVTIMSNFFKNCSKLKELDLSNFNTSNVTTMFAMFYNDSSLSELNVSSFDTSKIVNIGLSGMFYNCSNLEILNLNHFNVSNVTDFSYLFYGCSNLKNIDVSSWDTSNATDMNNIFAGMSSLKNLDISNFNTSKVNNMSGMFNGLSLIETLSLSNLNTSLVNNATNMFSGDVNLKIIDLRNADLSAVNDGTDFLTRVPVNAKIYLKDTQGNRNFMNNNFSSYSNVQYISS